MKSNNLLYNAIYDEFEFCEKLVDFAGARVLELGCGKGQFARSIAKKSEADFVVAMDVDQIQLEINIKQNDIDRIYFVAGGAEAIPYPDESFEVVIFIKSFHHIPIPEMDRSLREVRRVLGPNGVLYISEPAYEGGFNDLVSIFHDEKRAREEAIYAINRAVFNGLFEQKKVLFFFSALFFLNFSQFEDQIIRATHSNHNLNRELYDKVSIKFHQNMTPDGAKFIRKINVFVLTMV